MNAAVITRLIRCLTELEVAVLAGEALPAFRRNPRRIASAGGVRGGVGVRTVLDRLSRAICILAIDRAGNVQIAWHRQGFIRICHVGTDGVGTRRAGSVASSTATRSVICRTTGIVDHVNASVLVP